MSTPPSTGGRRIAIIGGGITGLAAAHRITELDPSAQLTLFEAGPRIGGVLRTEQQDGFLLEHSADNFITTTPWATSLCRRLGLAEDLLTTNEVQRRALVLCRGRLERVPDGFQLMAPARVWPILTTPVLSWRGKLRLLCEPFVPPRQQGGDESLASFVRRRLGREAYERLVQPLVGGIYTADAEKLSIRATLSRFVEMEQRHGSLTMGLRAAQQKLNTTRSDSGARYSLFMAPREGMRQLVDALALRLAASTVRLNCQVQQMARDASGAWRVRSSGESDEAFEAVIVAAPAPAAAGLLQSVDAELSHLLQGIPYAGCAIVLMGYRRQQIGHPLDGFGFVVPETENRQILAGSISSNKFPGRAAMDHVLLRVFVGGARHPELVERDDEALRQMVQQELAEILSVHGEPELFQVVRWRNAMPQYHLGHQERVRQIEARAAALPNLTLAGNAYHGVGIPDCIRSGEMAAEAVLKRARPREVPSQISP